MDNFEDHSYQPKETLFGTEYLEVKYHEFTLEESEWYLGERPYDELDGQIGNAVIAIKSFIRNGEIEVPEKLGSSATFEVESKIRELLEQEEPGVYFEGTDSPLAIRLSAMQNALKPNGNHDEDGVYSKLWGLMKKRYGLNKEEQEELIEDEFIILTVQNLGLADFEFNAFESPKSRFNSILSKYKPDKSQE